MYSIMISRRNFDPKTIRVYEVDQSLLILTFHKPNFHSLNLEQTTNIFFEEIEKFKV